MSKILALSSYEQFYSAGGVAKSKTPLPEKKIPAVWPTSAQTSKGSGKENNYRPQSSRPANQRQSTKDENTREHSSSRLQNSEED